MENEDVITTPAEIMGESEEVEIYNDNDVSIYSEESYTVKDFIDSTFGGFNNTEFYDYCTLFFIIIIFVLGFRIVSLIFSNK